MPKTRPSNASAAAVIPVKRATSPLPFTPLDKTSFTPMYAQIQEQLFRLIQSSRLRAGDLLPGEEELSRIFAVSRMTSRQALQSLKNKGLAARHKGKGTFVTQPKVEKDIAHLAGFTAEIRALGMRPGSRVLAAETMDASSEIAARLHIPKGAPVFRLSRLRLSNGHPVAIEESSLSLARFPGIQKISFAHRSLYETLRERYGIRFGMADEIIEARPAARHEGRLLEIPPRSSLLVIARTLWTAEGEPFEATCSCYRGDRYRAVLRIPATTLE